VSSDAKYFKANLKFEGRVRKIYSGDKRSSLFCGRVGDGEKKVYNIVARARAVLQELEIAPDTVNDEVKPVSWNGRC
jgi:hypothetical protein